jgi:uncharacterized protein (AIM24 family)
MTSATYTCPYCRQPSDGGADSCPNCGAPIDIALRTTSGGWIELPGIADMTRIQAGHSSVEIEGQVAPVADWNLAAGEGVFFPHHKLLWQDASVQLSAMPMSKPFTRLRAGLPLVMAQATGPGHVAFSHDAAGELIAVPLQAGSAVDVAEHRLVVATQGVGFDWHEANIWYSTSGRGSADQAAGVGLLKFGLEMAGMDDGDRDRRDETEWHYPMGRFMDRFSATDRPGLVMLGAGGTAFIRDLAQGETILVKPPALLFKDPSVAMQLHVEYPHAGMKFWRTWGNRYLWLRLWGPGRVGLESAYESEADPGTDFQSTSQHTQHMW